MKLRLEKAVVYDAQIFDFKTKICCFKKQFSMKNYE